MQIKLQNPNRTFGISLEDLSERENRRVPRLAHACFAYIKENGTMFQQYFVKLAASVFRALTRGRRYQHRRHIQTVRIPRGDYFHERPVRHWYDASTAVDLL